MVKSYQFQPVGRSNQYSRLLAKISLIMKLSFIFLVLSLNVAFASHSYAQKTFLSIDLNNKTVSEVLDAIEHQSEFRFYYNSKLVDTKQKVSVNVNHADVFAVLNQLFAATKIGYKVVDKDVILVERDINSTSPQLAIAYQGISITGKVTDDVGDPMPGVNVVVKGTATGQVTDIEGLYTVYVPNTDATLVFSFIGFVTQEIIVGNQRTINVSLSEDTKLIDEVVVVGYGTQRKLNLTGSVASMSANSIQNVPVSNISNALAGRMPGLFSYNKSGVPGSTSPVVIRGASTPNNTAPLYIIDGIERGKTDFDALDPNEIENISMLKDAASAAVYGSKAANGVILVTTKRGTSGQTQFKFSAIFGTQRPTRSPEVLTAFQRATYVNNKNDQNPNSVASSYYTQDELEYFKTHSTDWRDEAWVNPFQMQYNLGASGGTEKLKYYASVGYYDEKGSFENISFKKYNLRSNIDAQLTDNLSMRLDIDGSIRNRERPFWPYDGDDDFMNDMYRALMNFPATEPSYVNGRPNATIYNWNILEVIRSGGYKKTNSNIVNSQISFNYNVPFVEGLSAGFMFNYRYESRFIKQFSTKYTLYIHETSGANNHLIKEDAKVVGTRTRTDGDYINRSNNQYNQYTLNASLNYARQFGKHDVGALFVYEQREASEDYFMGQRKEPLTYAIDEMFIGSDNSSNFSTTGNAGESGRLGYVGRVNYAYDSKYLLELNFRYDGNYKFAPGHQWGFFPSASAGWRISEENFFRNLNAGFINNLKLRASYGLVGDDGGDDVAAFQWQARYAKQSAGAVFGSVTSGILPSVYPNPQITWEKVAITDIGFDVNMWNGLLSFEFDYFFRKRTDILLDRVRTVPATFGATLPKENYGEVHNWGLEFLARHENTVGGVKYYVTGNFSFARNKYVVIDEAANARDFEKKTGRPMKFITGYWADGIARTDADLAGLPTWSTNKYPWHVGDVRLRDINSAGGVPGKDGYVDSNDQDVLSLKSIDPEITYGLTVGASWKGFDINLFFNGVANRKIMFPNRGDTWTEQTVLRIWDDCWTSNNINAKYPRVNGLSSESYGANGQASSFWLFNAGYCRLKNLEIGYTLPKAWTGKIRIDNCRIYASGTNLFVIDNIDIYDPENSGDRGAYQYPQMKTFNVGINLSF